MSGILKTAGLILGGLAVVFSITYIILVMFFTERFNSYTYINGIDATGMTVSELSNSLSENDYSDYSLLIKDYDGTEYVVGAKEIGLLPNYSENLSNILNSQRNFEWPVNVAYATSYEVKPSSFFYDQDKFNSVLDGLSPFMEYDNEKADVHIERRLGKYFLVDNTKPVIDANKAKALISNSIIKGKEEVSLEECYSDVQYTPAQKKYINLFEYIDTYQKTDITYVDEELYRHLDFTEMNKWLLLDKDEHLPYVENGKLAIDEEKVNEYIDSLAVTFNTADDKVTWTRKNGTKVDLPFHGTGFKIDITNESTWLKEKIYSGNKYERKPMYSQKATGRGNKIVGDTYIEVDFENQKMYCYVDGELKLKSDCVTGNLRAHNDTPEMVSTIYFMQKGRTLVGENYRTFVYDWMAFYKAYGLHDATWRSKFGGDIYKTSGSHGCVNLPKTVADELYELAYVGMPVVLYYGEDYDR